MLELFKAERGTVIGRLPSFSPLYYQHFAQ